jgi:hypothetical protein
MLRSSIALVAIALGPQTFASTVIIPGAQVKDILWRGYNSETRSLQLPCVQGDIQFTPIEKASFGFLYDQTYESIMRESAGKAMGSINAVVLSGKASREFLIRKSQNNQSVHALWSFEYEKAWASNGEPEMNLIGQSAAERDLPGRVLACGDSFVSKALIGTKIYISASLYFFTKEAYQRFKTKVSASALGGLVKKSKTSIEEVREFSESAIFSVSATQIGGNEGKLSSLLQGGEIRCTLTNVDACADRYETLINYAKSSDIFPADSTPVENMPVLMGLTNYYSDYGLDLLASYQDHPDSNLIDKSQRVSILRADLSSLLWEMDILLSEKIHYLTPNQRKSEIDSRLNILAARSESIRHQIQVCEEGGAADDC